MKKEAIFNKFILVSFLTSIFLFQLISSAGVSAPYWKDYPLEIYPGDTKIINLTLQNMVGSEDIVFKAKIINDADGIASLKEDEYLVLAGQSDIKVPLEISIPKNIVVGEERIIELNFEQTSFSTQGMVTLGSSFSVPIPIKIIQKPEIKDENKDLLKTVFIILIILLLISILTIILLPIIRKKRNKHH